MSRIVVFGIDPEDQNVKIPFGVTKDSDDNAILKVVDAGLGGAVESPDSYTTNDRLKTLATLLGTLGASAETDPENSASSIALLKGLLTLLGKFDFEEDGNGDYVLRIVDAAPWGYNTEHGALNVVTSLMDMNSNIVPMQFYSSSVSVGADASYTAVNVTDMETQEDDAWWLASYQVVSSTNVNIEALQVDGNTVYAYADKGENSDSGNYLTQYGTYIKCTDNIKVICTNDGASAEDVTVQFYGFKLPTGV